MSDVCHWLEIKDTKDSNIFIYCFDLLLSIGRNGQLYSSLYDKRDNFNSHYTNVRFMDSKIPSSDAYGVFILPLIRHVMACSSYCPLGFSESGEHKTHLYLWLSLRLSVRLSERN